VLSGKFVRVLCNVAAIHILEKVVYALEEVFVDVFLHVLLGLCHAYDGVRLRFGEFLDPLRHPAAVQRVLGDRVEPAHGEAERNRAHVRGDIDVVHGRVGPVGYVLDFHDWPSHRKGQTGSFASAVERAFGDLVPQTGQSVDFTHYSRRAGEARPGWVIRVDDTLRSQPVLAHDESSCLLAAAGGVGLL